MTTQQRGKVYLVLSVIWTIISLFAFLAPRGTVDVDRAFFIPGMDKIAHFIIFAIWIFLVAMAIRKRKKSMDTRMLFLFFTGLALLTEILQIFIDGRSFDLRDLLANFLGLVAGLLIYRRV